MRIDNIETEDFLIAQMKEYFKISRYLETKNETEFFKQASVLFERYIEKSYRGTIHKPTHLEKRDWFFDTLSKNNIPWANSAKRFIQLLNKCRNYIMHNLDPKVDKEILRTKLIKEFKDIFSEIMELEDRFPDNNNELKRIIINFGRKHSEIYSKELFSKIKNQFGTQMDTELITYDSNLYYIIINIYFLINGTVEGIKQAHSSYSK